MRTLFRLIILLLIGNLVHAQKYMTQNGVISFYSSTPVEDIEAINNQASGVINSDNGEIAAVLLMKAFNFEKALMQEHFNEKYVESDKFPKSMFKGQIVDYNELELNDKPTEINIEGSLTIHGVTKPIAAKGSLAKKGDSLNLLTEFTVSASDFDISIPGPVRDKIAKELQVNVQFDLKQM